MFNWVDVVTPSPVAHAVLALSIVAALGLALGKLGVRGIRLGAAGVLGAGSLAFRRGVRDCLLQAVQE